MLRFFRINDPYRLLGLLVLFIALSLPLFIDSPAAIFAGRESESRQLMNRILAREIVALGNGGKAMGVAKQDRHRPRLTAQHELVRVCGQPLNQLWREVLAEGAAHLPALCLFAKIVGEHHEYIDCQAADQRVGDV